MRRAAQRTRPCLEQLESRFAPAIFGADTEQITGWGLTPERPVAADINSDGDLDWAAASVYEGDRWITVREGNGDGTFGSFVSAIDIPDVAFYDYKFADLDGDTDLDLVFVGGSGGSGGLKVYLNNGSGGFGSATNLTTEDNPYHVEVADLDEDSDLDLLVMCYQSESSVNEAQIFLGNTGSTFDSPTDILLTDTFRVTAHVGDIDNDNDLDFGYIDFGSDDFCYLLGNGNGTFASQATKALGSTEGAPRDFVFADLDDDGDDDIVVSGDIDQDTWGIKSYLWGGSSFGSRNDFVSDFFNAGAGDIVAADFNDDGDIDIVVLRHDFSPGGDDKINVFLGNGDGSFDAHEDYAAGDGPDMLAVGDFNEDGLPDLVVTNFDGDSVSTLINTSDE